MEKEKRVIKFKLRLRDKAFLLALFFLLSWIGWKDLTNKEVLPKEEPSNQIRLKVGENFLKAEVVVSPEDKYRGLSGRSSLEKDAGMLFLDERAGRQPYVMRGMNFPLDFIFIKDKVVVDFKEKISPDFKEKIVGEVDYDSVLEVEAGWIERKGLKVGEPVIRLDN